MKIVVYPHDMSLGGSQLNAIELAAAVRDLGHDVVVFGRPGPLQGRIEELGLELIVSPPVGRRPTARVVGALRRLARERDIDVVHGYEWPPALEAVLATAGGRRVCVATVMSMSVAPFIPRHVPLTVGTAQIADVERRRGRTDVTLIEPPVDLEHNAPHAVADPTSHRGGLGLREDDIVVACVTRLAHELKLEGILTAIEVVPELHPKVRLLIVGDGPARAEVQRAAAARNASLGREGVVLTGELRDPRPAYSTADIALGMGGSALRAMAFSKPLVVQGERGFWKVLTPDSLEQFLWTGWYGIGANAVDGPSRLAAELQPLLMNQDRRADLGRLSRRIVEERFSLQGAAAEQVKVYERATQAERSSGQLIDDARAATSFVRHVAHRRLRRLRGIAATDDFNAVPVAAMAGATRR